MKKIVFCLALVCGILLTFGCESMGSVFTGSSGSSGSSSSSSSSSSSGTTASSGKTSSGTTSSAGKTTSSTTSEEDEQVNVVFKLTNSFRTGSEAYYWNSDNKTKTSLVGKLGTLKLDADLCRVAKIRAEETVKSFSHTRPDGRSCFTVLKDLSIGYTRVGENIAAGNGGGERTFLQWKEDDKDYAGQGHRRNMLGDFTKIGIARAYDPNARYRYYWVMILAK